MVADTMRGFGFGLILDACFFVGTNPWCFASPIRGVQITSSGGEPKAVLSGSSKEDLEPRPERFDSKGRCMHETKGRSLPAWVFGWRL